MDKARPLRANLATTAAVRLVLALCSIVQRPQLVLCISSSSENLCRHGPLLHIQPTWSSYRRPVGLRGPAGFPEAHRPELEADKSLRISMYAWEATAKCVPLKHIPTFPPRKTLHLLLPRPVHFSWPGILSTWYGLILGCNGFRIITFNRRCFQSPVHASLHLPSRLRVQYPP